MFFKVHKDIIYIFIIFILILKVIHSAYQNENFLQVNKLPTVKYNNIDKQNKIILNNFINNNINNNNKKILKYNKNNKFKIVQFTDLHYGESEESDILTLKSQDLIIENEKPNIVILSGDIISGYKYSNVSQYLEIWNILTQPMIKREIPWAITFGNHDCEGPLSCLDIAQIDMSYNLSLTQIDIMNHLPGLTNYQLNIFSNDYNGSDSFDTNSAKSLIYIFDSETEGCQNSEPYGCIQKEQVDWYKNISNTFNKKEAIAFVHIPPYEILDVWNNKKVIGDFGDTEVCCYYTEKSHFIDAIIEQGDIKGLYFGHDHGNDFHGNLGNLNLGYGRKSGFGSYNPETLVQGARVFEITSHPSYSSQNFSSSTSFSIKTWIRNYLGEKDIQNIHHPKFSDIYNIICCVPGDIRSKPVVSRIINIGLVILSTVIICVLVFIFYKIILKNKNNKKIIN